ncbi:hypothetical protein V5799_013644 [Amblyomma americanum]|uniref:Spaetzle domain-containing protein n=1 Tax=Amblyomma americanum TaxID=6943 RepID=A0AAQ4E5A7_AMBAM
MYLRKSKVPRKSRQLFLTSSITCFSTPQNLLTGTATTEPAVVDFEPSYAAGEPFTHEPPEHPQSYASSSSSTTAAEPLFSLLDSNSIDGASPLGQSRPASQEHQDEGDQAPLPGPQPLRRGVNACPVKQEVLAPYWANNTRGKVLALLNVYPFEQYVHAEKCAFENEQMFCRDGCRCEQQFRLHRLLAFDPRNECRGIFADWFRFPSCCVCICYDVGSPP